MAQKIRRTEWNRLKYFAHIRQRNHHAQGIGQSIRMDQEDDKTEAGLALEDPDLTEEEKTETEVDVEQETTDLTASDDEARTDTDLTQENLKVSDEEEAKAEADIAQGNAGLTDEEEEDFEGQPLSEHLRNTAAFASAFAVHELSDLLYNAGLLHDLGKYQELFQRKIRGEKMRVDHSACGAAEAGRQMDGLPAMILEYIIAGHHAGLPDGGNGEKSLFSGNSLSARLQRETSTDVDAGRYEIRLTPMNIPVLVKYVMYDIASENLRLGKEQIIDYTALLIRYCFSCLTDADARDTSRFCAGIEPELLHSNFTACLTRLDQYLQQCHHETFLQKERPGIQAQAYAHIQDNADIYCLDMPAGSGKTLCGMACALLRALAEQKKRIIYFIPYGGIPAQTIHQLEEIFGADAQLLCHWSSCSAADDEQADDVSKVQINQAAEDWNAELIVTTLDHFLEMLFSNRRDKLRKMHNMADSILIFDELGLLPLEYLQPCLEGITFLTEKCGSSAMILTAAMPDAPALFERYADVSGLKICSLVPDRSHFSAFDRHVFRPIGLVADDELFRRVSTYPSALVVVNSSHTAREIYESFGGCETQNLYYLSDYLTPKDLQVELSEIVEKLQYAWKYPEDVEHSVLVVTTPRAGADAALDFHAVFREFAGLLHILRTGGRCNREGRVNSGDVWIFDCAGAAEETDGTRKGDRDADSGDEVEITRQLIEEFDDIASEECIREYFQRVYMDQSSRITEHSMHQYCTGIADIPFASYPQETGWADQCRESIVVPEDEKAKRLLEQIRESGVSRAAVRALQEYTCRVSPDELKKLYSMGAVHCIELPHGAERNEKGMPSGIFFLDQMNLYSVTDGLRV